ncbi:MAG: helix-turn-helix transcriptional regulator [Hungatella sp.]|jgi:transcriptional regulator with XRE-family HTH domain|nr:helix-turn-helix transcriptional regulator [Hungatella sp.]
MYDLGEKIKLLRTARGLTQTQLAKKLNLSKSSISKYESGQKFPTLETLINLAAFFHTSLDELVGLEKGATISVSGLTPSQLAIIESLLVEFRSDKKLKKIIMTPHQKNIFDNMLIEFLSLDDKSK